MFPGDNLLPDDDGDGDVPGDFCSANPVAGAGTRGGDAAAAVLGDVAPDIGGFDTWGDCGRTSLPLSKWPPIGLSSCSNK